MSDKEIQIILNKHREWIVENTGERANLKGADLRGVNLRGVNLKETWRWNNG